MSYVTDDLNVKQTCNTIPECVDEIIRCVNRGDNDIDMQIVIDLTLHTIKLIQHDITHITYRQNDM